MINLNFDGDKIFCKKSNSLIKYVSIKVNLGSLNDKIGGETHFLEHIMGTYISNIIDKNEILCTWDAYTNYFSTVFTFKLLKKDFSKFNQIILPKFFSLSENDINSIIVNERKIIKEEIKYYKSNYSNALLEKSLKHFFKEIKFDELGTIRSLESINAKVLFDIYKKYYNIKNCKLILSEDYSKRTKCQEVNVDLKQMDFSILNQTPRPFCCTYDINKDQIGFMISFKLANLPNAGVYKLILDYYYGSENSFLWSELRQKKGYIYNFISGCTKFGDSLLVINYVETSKTVKNEVINEIYKNLANPNFSYDKIIKDIDKIIFYSLDLLDESKITQNMADNPDEINFIINNLK